MTLPVSDGVQGAYVVACVCTGAILGGAATIFKELTESLGCLLGGFCLSMWLLTLHEGGLLTNTAGKTIFIIVFTLAGFVLYFSRFTRAYALIWAISFSGATATVLGIDCFSKAGLKEFWAYIWALNDNLFPSGADTYPLTRGIRVEIALIIILSLIGMISQLKLWRVIQEHRAKRMEARAEAQKQRDIEEATVGEQVEAQAAVDRQEWEAAYGGKASRSLNSSKDSGISEINEKKGRVSQTVVRADSNDGDRVIELSDMSNPKSLHPVTRSKDESAEIDLAKSDNEGRTVIRTAEDDAAAGANNSTTATQGKVWVARADREARPASPDRNSRRSSKPNIPAVTPLPFRVPEDDERDNRSDRSSFATFAADDDDRSVTLSKRASRASLGKRLSISSGHLLHSMSRNSLRSTQSKRKTGEFPPTGLAHEWTGSQEDLVLETRVDRDAGSVAATIDDLSTDDNAANLKEADPNFALELTAELSEQVPNADEPTTSPNTGKPLARTPNSTADTIGTDAPNAVEGSQALPQTGTPEKPASAAPSTTSTPASLTKDRLPTGPSRVASTYRTNEWAKHLSQADIPEPEKLQPSQNMTKEETANDAEIAAPVNTEALQQTAENATPAPAMVRSQSPSTPQLVSRSSSRTSAVKGQGLGITVPLNPEVAPQSTLVKASGPPSVHATRGFKKRTVSAGQRAADNHVQPIAEEQSNALYAEPQHMQDGLNSGRASPISVDYSSPSPRAPVPGVVSYTSPQTLLGKREMLIRSRSSIMGMSTPDPRTYSPQPPASDGGSLHNSPSYNSLMGQDADDMPLSQRKQLMRQSSIMSGNGSRPTSNAAIPYVNVPGQTSQTMTEASNFNSHQPVRHSILPSQQARDAQLASFRNSVTQDVRAASPAIADTGVTRNSGRDYLPSQLHQAAMNTQDVRRSLDQSRNMLLNQKSQEAQRKEMERMQKERNDRAMEEGMRSNPQLIDAHRDAMRRLQGSARS